MRWLQNSFVAISFFIMRKISSKFSQGFFYSLTVILAAVFLLSPAATGQAAGNAIFSLSSSNETVTVGSAFTVAVNLNTNGEAIDTARLVVNYPAGLLRVSNFTLDGILPSTVNGANSINNTAGVLSEGGYTVGAPFNGSGYFGTITFQALVAGTANITFGANNRLIANGVEKINAAGLSSIAVTINPSNGACFAEDFTDNPLSASKWFADVHIETAHYDTANGQYIFDLIGVGNYTEYLALKDAWLAAQKIDPASADTIAKKLIVDQFVQTNNKYLFMQPVFSRTINNIFGKKNYRYTLDDFKAELKFSGLVQSGANYRGKGLFRFIAYCSDNNTTRRIELNRASDGTGWGGTWASVLGYLPPEISIKSSSLLNSSSGIFRMERTGNSFSFFVDGVKFHQMDFEYVPRACVIEFAPEVQLEGSNLRVTIDDFKIFSGCYAASCGDGVVESPAGEKCDLGGQNGAPGSGCSATCGNIPTPDQCRNGVDDDSDGTCDWNGCMLNGKPLPPDFSCTSADDQDETNPKPACSNEADDDGDLRIDYYGFGATFFDPGCSSYVDNDETDPVSPPSFCGDGVANTTDPDRYEECDLGDQNGVPGSGCTITCLVIPIGCGNGVLDTDEECDLGDQNGVLGSGCSNICKITLIKCGNSVIDEGEQCDLGDQNGEPGSGCSETCQKPAQPCGNGVLDTGEECDLGEKNGEPGSGCTASCTIPVIPSVCGDGVINVDLDEECDLGEKNGEPGSGCTASCTIPAVPAFCGDGVTNVDLDEKCDLGDQNGAPGSGCTLTCKIIPVGCGNGEVGAGEQCDLGDQNGVPGSGCSTTCELIPVNCGNSVVDFGEDCDLGLQNGVPGSGCSDVCKLSGRPAFCGDGVTNVSLGEQCDLGSEQNGAVGSGCAADCQLSGQNEKPICGNGLPEEGEECDLGDQNGVKDSGCSTVCLFVGPLINVKEGLVGDVFKDLVYGNETLRQIFESPVVQFLQKEIFNNPEVEAINENIIAPALFAVAVVNTVPALGLLPYLQYIFTEPFRFLFYRRRKYGVIYNSLTKQPVDLAVVRLYNAQTNRLVTTKVTDSKGRYIFITEPGQYYIKVKKENFIFPSSVLGKKIRDHDYADLYYGAPVVTTEKENVVNLNVPIDPDVTFIPDRKVIRANQIKKARKVLAYLGPILAFVSWTISPTTVITIILVGHILLFVLFRRLAGHWRPKSFGVVFDSTTKRAVKNAIVRLFDVEYNKLLATQVASSAGKYNFLVGSNNYYLTVSSNGYQTYRSPALDFSKSKEAVIDKDVSLDKSAASSTSGQAPINQFDKILTPDGNLNNEVKSAVTPTITPEVSPEILPQAEILPTESQNAATIPNLSEVNGDSSVREAVRPESTNQPLVNSAQPESADLENKEVKADLEAEIDESKASRW